MSGDNYSLPPGCVNYYIAGIVPKECVVVWGIQYYSQQLECGCGAGCIVVDALYIVCLCNKCPYLNQDQCSMFIFSFLLMLPKSPPHTSNFHNTESSYRVCAVHIETIYYILQVQSV